MVPEATGSKVGGQAAECALNQVEDALTEGQSRILEVDTNTGLVQHVGACGADRGTVCRSLPLRQKPLVQDTGPAQG